MNQPKNAFYAQSGGVTAVINASACGVIETARQRPESITKLYAGLNGILGVLDEALIDTNLISAADIAQLKHTPGGAFGSCRYKLNASDNEQAEYQRLLAVFQAHDIGYFFYNGGGDSADTCLKISQLAATMGYPLRAIHIPKTVDNDLPLTDCSPGFASVAKYVATSILEASLDVVSMAQTSTKVFIFEVMGRHAGWIAAACGLASQSDEQGPHLILFPEIAFDPQAFLQRVQHCVHQYQHCVIAVAEGIRDIHGQLLGDAGGKDAFGHSQLGGVAPKLAQLIQQQLGYKYHWAVADYLQRAARHLAAKTDVEQAYAVGRAAVQMALAGENAVMPAIRRLHDTPYTWDIIAAPLSDVANQEKQLPHEFIRSDGFHITAACRRYLQPLIHGEAFPPFKDGLPSYVRLDRVIVKRKLAAFKA